MFGGSDTTYDDIVAAIADKTTFDKIFMDKANLGKITYDTPVVLGKISGTLATADKFNVTGSVSVDGETEATFSASLNGTDGFIYFGYAAG